MFVNNLSKTKLNFKRDFPEILSEAGLFRVKSNN